MTNTFGRFSLVLVAVTDPAIDREAMRAKITCADGEERSLFEVYTITRDEQYLRLKAGAKPLRFDLSPLRQRHVNRLVEDPDAPQPDELWSIAAASIVGVDDPSGKLRLDEEADFHKPDSDGRRALKSDAMERIARAIGTKAVREIGITLFQRAALPEWALAPFVSAPGSEPTYSKTG